MWVYYVSLLVSIITRTFQIKNLGRRFEAISTNHQLGKKKV